MDFTTNYYSRTSEMPVSSRCIGVYSWAWSLILRMVCYETTLGETNCSPASSDQLDIACGIGMEVSGFGMGAFVNLPLNAHTPSATGLLRPCACCHSSYAFIYTLAQWVLDALLFLVSSVPLALTNFPSFPPKIPWALRVWNWWRSTI